MPLPITFANLPAGYSPLALLDQDFVYLDNRITGLVAGGGQVNDLGVLAGTVAVDLTKGQAVEATALGANTWSFVNLPAAGFAFELTLYLTNGGLGVQTWPLSVVWGTAGAPVLSAGATDLIAFTTLNGGTIWYGRLLGKGF